MPTREFTAWLDEQTEKRRIQPNVRIEIGECSEASWPASKPPMRRRESDGNHERCAANLAVLRDGWIQYRTRSRVVCPVDEGICCASSVPRLN